MDKILLTIIRLENGNIAYESGEPCSEPEMLGHIEIIRHRLLKISEEKFIEIIKE